MIFGSWGEIPENSIGLLSHAKDRNVPSGRMECVSLFTKRENKEIRRGFYFYINTQPSNNMNSAIKFLKKLNRWESFRIGLSIPFFIYAILAISYSYTIKDSTLLFAIMGIAIGAFGIAITLISSVLTDIEIRNLK